MLTIDGLQYSRWSRKIFEQMRQGELDCVHFTSAYRETAMETLRNIGQWNQLFEQHGDLIMRVGNVDDLQQAGFTTQYVSKIMGESWREFFAKSFSPEGG